MKIPHIKKQAISFHLSYLSLLLADLFSVYWAYLSFYLSGKLLVCALFTGYFSVANIFALNLIFVLPHAKESFESQEVSNPFEAFNLDIQAIGESLKPLILLLFFVFGCLLAYESLCLVLLDLLSTFLVFFSTPVGIVFFVLMTIGFVVGLAHFCIGVYGRSTISYSTRKVVGSLFSLSEKQKDILMFFRKHPKAYYDPFILFLGLTSFLKESNIFYVGMYLIFFRFDGGLSFCLLSVFFIGVTYITLLKKTRELLFQKYDSSCLKDLAFNVELLFLKHQLSKGPKVALATFALGVLGEGYITGRQFIEQKGLNELHKITTDADNLAADKAGVPRPTPEPVKIAPRRNPLTGAAIK
jgi:hypothetical protein